MDKEPTDVCPVISKPIYDSDSKKAYLFKVACLKDQCRFWVSAEDEEKEFATHVAKEWFGVDAKTAEEFKDSCKGFCMFEV